MPSRAEPRGTGERPVRGEFQATGARSLRGALELMLRAIALAALAFVLWSELTRAGAGAATRVLSADSASVVPTLARLSRDPAVASAHLTMSSTPGAATRDWLRALRGAGVDLGWSGPLPPAMVLAAEPVPSALPRVRLAVASPVPVIVSDEVGAIDTLPEGGGAIIVAGVQGAVEARGVGGAGGAGETGGRIAATRLADSLLVRRV